MSSESETFVIKLGKQTNKKKKYQKTNLLLVISDIFLLPEVFDRFIFLIHNQGRITFVTIIYSIYSWLICTISTSVNNW